MNLRKNMNRIAYTLGLVMLCCSSVCADIQRELQHEIDYINILLSDPEWSAIEREYLRCRSEGIFRAIEIVHDHGIF